MVSRSLDELRARAEALGAGTVVDTVAVAGGGTLPGTEIASVGVAVDGDQRGALRVAPVPIIARVADGRTVLDLRTVEPDQDALVATALAGLLGGG